MTVSPSCRSSSGRVIGISLSVVRSPYEGRADTAVVGAGQQSIGQLRLVANMTSSGTPVSSRRSSSAAQSPGRYKARPTRACPAGAA